MFYSISTNSQGNSLESLKYNIGETDCLLEDRDEFNTDIYRENNNISHLMDEIFFEIWGLTDS